VDALRAVDQHVLAARSRQDCSVARVVNRRSMVPHFGALVEPEDRDGRERRITAAIVLGVGGR
jgi:hypothetical protein